MRNLFVLSIMLVLMGCTTRTNHGVCVGVVDQKDPKLKYELSYKNIFLAVLFYETLIVPAVVALKQLECPYAGE